MPHVRITQTSLTDLHADAVATRPEVVLCAVADAGAGVNTVRRLQRARRGQRVLFLTPPDASQERLEALEAGVDEALPTPIDDAELAGRLSLLVRRAGALRLNRLVIADDLELDLERRELVHDGRRIHLRPKEAGLLEVLARAPGRTLTRAHILERVWGRAYAGDPRTVDVHVRWLRAKIEPDPQVPVRLVTVRGQGYLFEPAALTKR